MNNPWLKLMAPLALLAFSPPGNAQESTRTAEIEAERSKKEAHLQPDEVTGVERKLQMFKDGRYLERFSTGVNGFRPKIGNLVTFGGFAFGLQYTNDEIAEGKVVYKASAQTSTKLYQKYATSVSFPKIASGRINVDLSSGYRNYRSLQYYGNGPDTKKEFRSNYLLEDTSVEGIGTLRLAKHLYLGGGVGYLWTNVGPGKDSRFASTETVFPPSVAPGIDQQSNFLRSGGFLQFDYRDNPAGPKQGGNYVIQQLWYRDNKLGLYGFRRFDVDLQQYISFLNKTHVIALRAKSTMTETDSGQEVPFYLRPYLGGSDDLRGYRPFRFSDRNSMVLNAEYRWEVFSGLDGAVFADAGKVTPRRGQLNFSNLESSVGFGLRFNARNVTVVRVDVGFSHEGYQVWFKFNDAFVMRRFGIAAGQPVY